MSEEASLEIVDEKSDTKKLLGDREEQPVSENMSEASSVENTEDISSDTKNLLQEERTRPGKGYHFVGSAKLAAYRFCRENISYRLIAVAVLSFLVITILIVVITIAVQVSQQNQLLREQNQLLRQQNNISGAQFNATAQSLTLEDRCFNPLNEFERNQEEFYFKKLYPLYNQTFETCRNISLECFTGPLLEVSNNIHNLEDKIKHLHNESYNQISGFMKAIDNIFESGEVLSNFDEVMEQLNNLSQIVNWCFDHDRYELSPDISFILSNISSQLLQVDFHQTELFSSQKSLRQEIQSLKSNMSAMLTKISGQTDQILKLTANIQQSGAFFPNPGVLLTLIMICMVIGIFL